MKKGASWTYDTPSIVFMAEEISFTPGIVTYTKKTPGG